MLVDGKDTKFGGEYLCPVCRDRAMAHMLGELQVRAILTSPSERFVLHHRKYIGRGVKGG